MRGTRKVDLLTAGISSISTNYQKNVNKLLHCQSSKDGAVHLRESPGSVGCSAFLSTKSTKGTNTNRFASFVLFMDFVGNRSGFI
jgi:hypothetical protein